MAHPIVGANWQLPRGYARILLAVCASGWAQAASCLLILLTPYVVIVIITTSITTTNKIIVFCSCPHPHLFRNHEGSPRLLRPIHFQTRQRQILVPLTFLLIIPSDFLASSLCSFGPRYFDIGLYSSFWYGLV